MEDILNLSYREPILTASLKGEIDHHSAVNVRTKIDEALFYYHPQTLVIDIGRVDFMDSSGLGLIMGRLAKTKELGISLYKYITEKRLIFANKLLEQGEKPTKIYVQCGYKDYPTFYKAYTKMFGKSPSKH